MKAIVVGDVHGCYDELQELLALLHTAGHINFKYSGNNARLIFLGDLIDRGRHSIECLRLVKRLSEDGRAECLAGNHENKHVRYRSHQIALALNGTPNPMKRMSLVDLAAQNEFTENEIDWMRKLPLTIPIHNDWIALHAGLMPGIAIVDQDPNQLIRCRYIDQDGKAAALNKDKSQPEGTVYWAECWDGRQNVVYGHNVHSLTEPRVDKRPNGVQCIGIDTGAVFGGRLTAAILDWKDNQKDPSISFLQVQSKTNYASLKERYEE